MGKLKIVVLIILPGNSGNQKPVGTIIPIALPAAARPFSK
jgi:hypothetical protein